MKQQTSAGIIVYIKKDNISHFLLLHYAAGHWDFPKGHLEAEETLEQAAHRELKEETGLIAIIQPSFSTNFSYTFTDSNNETIHKTVYFFLGSAGTKMVTLSHEHQDFLWLPYKQARKKLTYHNAQNALDKAHAFMASSL